MGNSVVVGEFCRVHFSQLQLKDKGKIVQTVPIVCK